MSVISKYRMEEFLISQLSPPQPVEMDAKQLTKKLKDIDAGSKVAKWQVQYLKTKKIRMEKRLKAQQDVLAALQKITTTEAQGKRRHKMKNQIIKQDQLLLQLRRRLETAREDANEWAIQRMKYAAA
jgi:hypothetical protein